MCGPFFGDASLLVSQQAPMRRGREKICLWCSAVAAQRLLQNHYQHIFTGKIPLAMTRSPRYWRRLQLTLNVLAREIPGGTLVLAASETALDQMLAKCTRGHWERSFGYFRALLLPVSCHPMGVTGGLEVTHQVSPWHHFSLDKMDQRIDHRNLWVVRFLADMFSFSKH